MMMNFETMQKQGKDGMDAAMKSLGALARGAQAATMEMTDFAKKAVEQGGQTVEKLTQVRSLDKALEIQGEYVRSSYQGAVAQSTKLGEIATATAKEAFAAVEGFTIKQPA